MMAYVGASQPEPARKTGKGRDSFPHTITEQLAATWQREGGPRPVPRPIDGTPHRPGVQAVETSASVNHEPIVPLGRWAT